MRRRARAALLGPVPALLAATLASADPADTAAARCAALWEGYARYADLSAYLDGAAAARADARRYRDRAVRETGDADAVDAYIARTAPDRVRMIDAAIHAGDRASREIFERALQRCP
ncbi:hypothetical protein ROJ8625_02293 [Roseivivax jejudonensis]|uniref:Lysozyme inhibitor LprI N-terminal domain-containing protein n=1 Tax=Roseivivax jejudonensis TaxID=1529041 RepID=A0A1X6ZC01_9RHOB|nr:hypothetical protein [Roseivivax jejudonensis]SLN47218.1 hypothetical protein ROJ8625_02293 [Roseivivax jejudonensis]